MLVVNLSDGRTIKFSYNHITDAAPASLSPDHIAGETRRMTTAEVFEVSTTQGDGYNASGYTQLGYGVTITHPKDTFSKYKGRKKATQYAMDAAGFTPAQRKEVWDAFLTEYGKRKA